MRRRLTCLGIVGCLSLVACSPGGSHNSVSESAANKAALTAIDDLARFQAKSAGTSPITGFVVLTDSLTTDTAAVNDSYGHVLTVSPAPREAWVVDVTAPPQGIWGSVSAMAEVDSGSGVVRGTGLWAVPYDAPVKPS